MRSEPAEQHGTASGGTLQGVALPGTGDPAVRTETLSRATFDEESHT